MNTVTLSVAPTGRATPDSGQRALLGLSAGQVHVAPCTPANWTGAPTGHGVAGHGERAPARPRAAVLFTKYRRFPLTSTSLLSPNSHSSDPSPQLHADAGIAVDAWPGDSRAGGPDRRGAGGGPAAPHRDGPADHGRAAGRSRLPLMTLARRGRRHVQQGDADAGRARPAAR